MLHVVSPAGPDAVTNVVMPDVVTRDTVMRDVSFEKQSAPAAWGRQGRVWGFELLPCMIKCASNTVLMCSPSKRKPSQSWR